jgi:3-deoxy-manno-octulosonate cytidylyltransferase (CMP-KDO synthetase)
MKVVALIPARLASSRLPQKLMKVLHGKTIIRRTYEAVVATNLFSDVIVVCDDEMILNEITQHGGKAMMSARTHESGSDRIAEIATTLDADIIVNIQGDEPFIEKEALEKVIQLFSNPDAQVTSLKKRITDFNQIQNPNCVKVVTDLQGKALYFSRSAIPFDRDGKGDVAYYQHIGVYAYRKEALLNFTQMPVSALETVEKLENLRMLENGMSIYLAEIDHVGISIDTEEDFAKAESYLDTLS